MLKSLCIILKLCTTLSGPATVLDGDTIIVEGFHVRLMGLDAEELSEPHGLQAKHFMQNSMQNSRITCILTGEKSYARYVGTCFRGGDDLSIIMVSSGYALDCARYSGGKYRQYEPPNIRTVLIQKGYCYG